MTTLKRVREASQKRRTPFGGHLQPVLLQTPRQMASYAFFGAHLKACQ